MATTHKTHSASHDTENSLSTDERKQIKGKTFAFPAKRKEPLNDASHVRNAIARFDQVKGVSDSERKEAFGHIKTAAKKFGVEMTETDRKQLGSKPHTHSAAKK